MIGRGDPKTLFKDKLRVLKRYQRKIERKKSSFKRNRKKEKFASLHGSPKWITIKNLRAKGFSWNEIDFAFFSMTLFGEARNLKEHDIENGSSSYQ